MSKHYNDNNRERTLTVYRVWQNIDGWRFGFSFHHGCPAAEEKLIMPKGLHLHRNLLGEVVGIKLGNGEICDEVRVAEDGRPYFPIKLGPLYLRPFQYESPTPCVGVVNGSEKLYLYGNVENGVVKTLRAYKSSTKEKLGAFPYHEAVRLAAEGVVRLADGFELRERTWSDMGQQYSGFYICKKMSEKKTAARSVAA